MNSNYEDDDYTVYSLRGTGTFADDNYDENEAASVAAEVEGYEEYSNEMTTEELESIRQLRSLERKVDYDAISKTDEFNEGLYNQLTDSDINLVVGLNEYLKEYGVFENDTYEIEATVESETLFVGASEAATRDHDIDPENYSEDSERALHRLQEIAKEEEEMSINPELEDLYNDDELDGLYDDSSDYFDDDEIDDFYDDEELEDDDNLIDEELDESVEDDEESVMIGESYIDNLDDDSVLVDDFEDEIDAGYLEEEGNVLSNDLDDDHTFDDFADSHYEDDSQEGDSYDSEDFLHEEPRSFGTRKLSIDDMITLKRMFSQGKLDDVDISAIYTGVSVSDVRRLREELMQ